MASKTCISHGPCLHAPDRLLSLCLTPGDLTCAMAVGQDVRMKRGLDKPQPCLLWLPAGQGRAG